MMSIFLDPGALKSSLALTKIIKPVLGDFSIRFSEDQCIYITSVDKRRSVTVRIHHGNDSEMNSEYYLPIDRTALFEADLKNLSISETEKGLSVKYSEDGSTRNALIKRRSSNSKRPDLPTLPENLDFVSIKAKIFDHILKMVSCAALVKETVTEEDMRINQIHFYQKESYVASNARFYGSQVYSPSLSLDLSLVSADIPYVRNFCSRAKGAINIAVDSQYIYIVDEQTSSWMRLAKVATQVPNSKFIHVDPAERRFSISTEVFKSVARWLMNSLDSSQRITIKIINEDDEYFLKCISVTGIELSVTKVESDSTWSADFPVSILNTIADHLIEGHVDVYYSPKDLNGILVFSQKIDDTIANHFLRSMKPR